jgi:hypothetical protein
MALATDTAKLEELLLEALLKTNVEKRLLSLNTRREILQDYKLSDNLIRKLMDIQADDLREFGTIATEILKSTYSEIQEIKTPLVVPRLYEKGFSPKFIYAFDRLLYRRIGRKNDIVFHFAGDIELDQIALLERQINEIYRATISEVETPSSLKEFARSNKVIKVRDLGHPLSTEIFFEVVRELQQPEFVVSVVSNVVANVIMAAMAYTLTQAYYKTYAIIKKQDASDEEQPIEEVDVEEVAKADLPSTAIEKSEELLNSQVQNQQNVTGEPGLRERRRVEVDATESYLVIRDQKYVIGVQRKRETIYYE